jgi:tRNA(Ile2)-agmatinylcytidine synthase
MYVAIDDTDSQDRMCTTYIIYKIISENKYDIIGEPRLVRLNPNIGYKTRGNGALNICLGKGEGRKEVIGRTNGKIIYSYTKIKEEPDKEDLIDYVSSMVEEFYVKDNDNTNPGVVVSHNKFNRELYSLALEEDINLHFIENFLEGRAMYRKFRNGHGIIGSAASLAWPEDRYTYELLDYRYPHYDDIDHDEKMEISKLPEKYASTFNNIDFQNKYPAIFPKPKTPVIFGVRGIVKNDLINIYEEIQKNHKIEDEGYIIYKTNQGTDDHIICDPNYLSDMGSYAVTGVISGNPYTIEGGHSFTSLNYKNMEFRLAAFEPTKEFRKILLSLVPGDIVTAYGSYQKGTIKLEKIKLVKKAPVYIKEVPVCSVCHVKTKSKGKMDFRCPSCHRRYKNPVYVEKYREINEGFYEVPVIARRHLSMPIKLAGYFYGNGNQSGVI